MKDILERLRGYNSPDRTIDDQRQIAVDIHDAAAEIDKLRGGLMRLRDGMATATNTNIVDYIDALLSSND